MKLFLKTPNNITEETLISAKVSCTALYSWEAANETKACHTQTASSNWLWTLAAETPPCWAQCPAHSSHQMQAELALSGTTRCEWPSLPCLCHQAQSAYLEGKVRNLLSSSPSHLPAGFQDRERQLCREGGSGVGAGGVLMEKKGARSTAEGAGKGGEDLKGEGRGSHVMPSSSTAEPQTNANPQSVLCANGAESFRDSHFPRKAASKTGEHHSFLPKLHWPFLAHSSMTFVDPQTHSTSQCELQHWILQPSWNTT